MSRRIKVGHSKTRVFTIIYNLLYFLCPSGAILCGIWNWEGSELLTSGEDGCLRIWSRSGMLRSTLAQCPEPIYAAAWAPDSLAAIYAIGPNLVIKPTIPNAKTIQWKGHEGVILCLSWSPTSKLIITGSEDCRYKVWDSRGHSLFSSGLHNHPINSLAWAPAGDLFSVGSFNILRVCDRYGVSLKNLARKVQLFAIL